MAKTKRNLGIEGWELPAGLSGYLLLPHCYLLLPHCVSTSKEMGTKE